MIFSVVEGRMGGTGKMKLRRLKMIAPLSDSLTTGSGSSSWVASEEFGALVSSSRSIGETLTM
jgi:hypothetical protein